MLTAVLSAAARQRSNQRQFNTGSVCDGSSLLFLNTTAYTSEPQQNPQRQHRQHTHQTQSGTLPAPLASVGMQPFHPDRRASKVPPSFEYSGAALRAANRHSSSPTSTSDAPIGGARSGKSLPIPNSSVRSPSTAVRCPVGSRALPSLSLLGTSAALNSEVEYPHDRGVEVGGGCFGSGTFFRNGSRGADCRGKESNAPRRRRLARQYPSGDEDMEFLRDLMEESGDEASAVGLSTQQSRFAPQNRQHTASSSPRTTLSSLSFGGYPTTPSTFCLPGTAVAPADLDQAFNQRSTREATSESIAGSLTASSIAGAYSTASATSCVSVATAASGGVANKPSENGIEDDEHEWILVTDEEKLQTADDVAALLWRADPGLRDRILARVNDTWAQAEAEMKRAAAAVPRARITKNNSGGGPASPGRHAASTFPFRKILMERLEATRQAVQADLQSADEATAQAANLCAGVSASTASRNAPKWRGSTALRGDVLEKLKDFQRCSKELKEAEIIQAAAGSAAAKNPAVREALLARLQSVRTYLVAQAQDLNQKTVISDKETIMRDGGVLDEIDKATEGLLEQLEANHQAAQRELMPKSSSGQEIMEGLLARLNATRTAAQAELEAADAAATRSPATEPLHEVAEAAAKAAAAAAVAAATRPCEARVSGVLTDDRDCSDNGLRFASDSSADREKRGGGSADETASCAGARVSGTTSKGKKRKRAPGGGRRCKHEGCSLHPHFGLTRPEYCSRHKLPGMFNVKGRRCGQYSCGRTPVYGNAGDPHPTFCAAHKLPNMMDIKNPTCREPSCRRQPSFGSPHDRRASFCASHMLPGMVNVRRMLASRAKGSSASVSSSPSTSPSHTAISPLSPSTGRPRSLSAAQNFAPTVSYPTSGGISGSSQTLSPMAGAAGIEETSGGIYADVRGDEVRHRLGGYPDRGGRDGVDQLLSLQTRPSSAGGGLRDEGNAIDGGLAAAAAAVAGMSHPRQGADEAIYQATHHPSVSRSSSSRSRAPWTTSSTGVESDLDRLLLG